MIGSTGEGDCTRGYNMNDKQFDWDAPWLINTQVITVGKIKKLPNGEPYIEYWTFKYDDTAPPLSANDLKWIAWRAGRLREEIEDMENPYPEWVSLDCRAHPVEWIVWDECRRHIISLL